MPKCIILFYKQTLGESLIQEIKYSRPSYQTVAAGNKKQRSAAIRDDGNFLTEGQNFKKVVFDQKGSLNRSKF